MLCNSSCRLAVPVIVRVDGLESGQDIFHSIECEQSFPCRQHSPEACVLRDYWTTSRQVAGAALTEPATAQAHILIFGDREFTTRGSHIIAVAPGVHGKPLRIGQAPPVRL